MLVTKFSGSGYSLSPEWHAEIGYSAAVERIRRVPVERPGHGTPRQTRKRAGRQSTALIGASS